MNQHDPTTATPIRSFNQETTISHSSLFNSEQPRSPIPTKRRIDHENGHGGIQGSQVNLIVTILGSLLNTSQTKDLRDALMTTYLTFIDVLLYDLMGYRVMKDYMALFHHEDVIINNKENDLDEQQKTIQLRARFHDAGIVFHSLQWVDSIFAGVYTKFLEINAQKQRKDHGQFYTPQSIVQFMWSTCLRQHPPSSSSPPPSLVQVPRVFDPCMGMGAFLCEYLTRLIDACMATPSVWNNIEYLKYMLCHAIPENLWGVEIDPFAYKIGKLNVLVHLFPFYKRIMELSIPSSINNNSINNNGNNDSIPQPLMAINRLHLFRNDTLKLTLYKDVSAWEFNELLRLRDPSQLKFDYIVTNPPYMIRKTGLVTEPDPALYDSQVLGGRGAQAYLYFMWICMLRCNPSTGQICLITPSQWMVLEFAQHLRTWMWQHCQLLGMYQFEPYKVWPKVQTDSLIFRLRMRHQQQQLTVDDNTITSQAQVTTTARENSVLFLRHMSRKAKLDNILGEYTSFSRENLNYQSHPGEKIKDPLLKFKWTSTDDIGRILKSPNASFAFLSPTSRLTDQLNDLTSTLPRICDADDAPLEFHRGPNTNPVYALVVRTQWARETFGKACFDRWLRPAIYWSGKSQGTDKESTFWLHRDPLRLARKEVSPAEAFVPLNRTDENGDPFYSMILVDKDGAEQLEKDISEQQQDNNYTKEVDQKLRDGETRLYQYLRDAREALQSTRDTKISWCHYNKCGVDVPVKIVHPINYGYFTKSQPRQRFFMDRNRFCVTNQCMYFTTKKNNSNNNDNATSSSVSLASPPPLSEEYYCALLNSSTVQFFIKEHCSYDQQGRMRFFGKHLANIPSPLPPTQKEDHIMAQLVHLVSMARARIYTITEMTKLQTLMERVRGGSWDLSVTDITSLRKFDDQQTAVQQDCQQVLQQPGSIWRKIFGHNDQNRYPTLLDAVIRTLQRASLCQYAIDQLAYVLYQIPQELQQSLESELSLTLTEKWKPHLEKFNLAHVSEDRIAWGNCIIEMINNL